MKRCDSSFLATCPKLGNLPTISKYEEKTELVQLLVEYVKIRELEDKRVATVGLRFDPNAISKAMPEVATKPALLKTKRIEIVLRNGDTGGSGGI